MYDCIVIGGGPGGLVSAIYLARFRRKVLVIDKGQSRLHLATDIKNLIGYADGISGKSLLHKLRRQLMRYNVQILMAEAEVRKKRDGFLVTANGEDFHSKFVVIATGLKDKQPESIDWMSLCQQGILRYCPVCDGFEQTNKKVAVFINSNTGFRKVRFISYFTKNLVVVAGSGFVMAPRNVNLVRKMGIKVIQGRLKSLQATVKNTLSVKLENHRLFEVQTGYVELGIFTPHSAFKKITGLRKIKTGRLMTNRHQQTSVKNLYAVGDCTNVLTQVSVAIGEAAIAATDIHNRLAKNKK